MNTATLKTLANESNETLAKAMSKVNATEEAKAKAMKEINDYKYARETIAKWFKAN